MVTEGRRRVAAGVVLGLLASSLAASLGAEAAVRETRAVDRPWSGFRITTTDRAAGSWIGARKVGRKPGRIVYRVDPRADRRADGFGRVRLLTSLPGPGTKYAAGSRATARAAWIVSKYGTLPNAFQSAAVDAALLHLLARHAYRLGGRQGKARLRQSGEPAAIRHLATIMLRDSLRRAGPYRVAAWQVGQSVIGGAVRIGVSAVVARSDVPLASVPVRVKVGSGPWNAVGETDAAGGATFSYVDPAAGPKPVSVRVGRAPETRLLVMSPRRDTASRVVVAGSKRTLVGGTTVYVKARPRVSVSSARIKADQRTSANLRVGGAYGTASRVGTAVLHGPFGSFRQSTCDRKTFRGRRITVSGNGRYRLPALLLHRAGIYVWRVALPGDRVNLPAATCDGAFRVTPEQ